MSSLPIQGDQIHIMFIEKQNIAEEITNLCILKIKNQVFRCKRQEGPYIQVSTQFIDGMCQNSGKTMNLFFNPTIKLHETIKSILPLRMSGHPISTAVKLLLNPHFILDSNRNSVVCSTNSLNIGLYMKQKSTASSQDLLMYVFNRTIRSAQI